MDHTSNQLQIYKSENVWKGFLSKCCTYHGSSSVGFLLMYRRRYWIADIALTFASRAEHSLKKL